MLVSVETYMNTLIVLFLSVFITQVYAQTPSPTAGPTTSPTGSPTTASPTGSPTPDITWSPTMEKSRDYTNTLHTGFKSGPVDEYDGWLAYTIYTTSPAPTEWIGKVGIMKRQSDGSYVDEGYFLEQNIDSATHFGRNLMFMVEDGDTNPTLLVLSQKESNGAATGFLYRYEVNGTGQFELTEQIANPLGNGGNTFGYIMVPSPNHEHMILVDYPSTLWSVHKDSGTLVLHAQAFPENPSRGAITDNGLRMVACSSSLCRFYDRADVSSGWSFLDSIDKPYGAGTMGGAIAIHNDMFFMCYQGYADGHTAGGLLLFFEFDGSEYQLLDRRIGSDHTRVPSNQLCTQPNHFVFSPTRIILGQDVSVSVFEYDGYKTVSSYSYVLTSYTGNYAPKITNAEQSLIIATGPGTTTGTTLEVYDYALTTDPPTAAPSTNPTVSPSESPSANPTTNPTVSPSESPSVNPTANPSASPSVSPSESPTSSPTEPTAEPTSNPSANPTANPSASPSVSPSESPTGNPTANPSASPSVSPSESPTGNPTTNPSASPSVSPSESPSGSPTTNPSANPTSSPTEPTENPTRSPTLPTAEPTANPSASPSVSPSVSPSESPTSSPVGPTLEPTGAPVTMPPTTAYLYETISPGFFCSESYDDDFPQGNTDTWEECEALCTYDDQCFAYHWNPSTKACVTLDSCRLTVQGGAIAPAKVKRYESWSIGLNEKCPDGNIYSLPSGLSAYDCFVACRDNVNCVSVTLDEQSNRCLLHNACPSTSPTSAGRLSMYMPVPTEAPTPMPTENPTINPTANPTVNPTVNPTTNPSANPTVNPTVNPTPSPTSFYSEVGEGSCKDADDKLFLRVLYEEIGSESVCASYCYDNYPSVIGFEHLMDYCQCVYSYDQVVYPDQDSGGLHNYYGRGVYPIVAANNDTSFICFKYNSINWGNVYSNSSIYKGEGTCSDASGNSFDKAQYNTVVDKDACGTLCYNKITSIGFEYLPDTDVCYCLFDDTNRAVPDDADSLDLTQTGTGYIANSQSTSGTFCYEFSTPDFATAEPTTNPSASPSASPSVSPTNEPTGSPTTPEPTVNPTVSPSESPSTSPTSNPTGSPTTPEPTTNPTVSPSASPSASPSESPSASPSANPTVNPSASPSVSPTVNPSASPSVSPTDSPTDAPSVSPTPLPSTNPSASPTTSPSAHPTVSPSASPTLPALECVAGEFRNTEEWRCDQCSSGSFSLVVNADSCDICDGGTYSNSAGSVRCSLCTFGDYQPFIGTFNCVACPEGFTNYNFGSTRCDVAL